MTHLSRKSKNSDKLMVNNNFQQEFILNHYNYKDGLSVIKNKTDISYNRVLRVLKLRCDVVKDKIGWDPQCDWYFGVLAFSQSNFYFLLQRFFDPDEKKGKESDSDRSRKTVSKERSDRSDMHKIDPMARTLRNFDLVALKKKNNELVAEGRKLTTRYVKKQEKVL